MQRCVTSREVANFVLPSREAANFVLPCPSSSSARDAHWVDLRSPSHGCTESHVCDCAGLGVHIACVSAPGLRCMLPHMPVRAAVPEPLLPSPLLPAFCPKALAAGMHAVDGGHALPRSARCWHACRGWRAQFGGCASCWHACRGRRTLPKATPAGSRACACAAPQVASAIKPKTLWVRSRTFLATHKVSCQRCKAVGTQLTMQRTGRPTSAATHGAPTQQARLAAKMVTPLQGSTWEGEGCALRQGACARLAEGQGCPPVHAP